MSMWDTPSSIIPEQPATSPANANGREGRGEDQGVARSLNLPLQRLSATSISTFINCPEQFRQKYILDGPDKLYGPRFMGAVDHKVAEEIIRRKMAGDTESSITTLYNETWERQLDEEGEPDWLDDDPVEMHKRGLAMIHTYNEEVIEKITPVEVERKVTYSQDGIDVVGYIDLICVNTETGELYIRERKTNSQKAAKPKAKWRFQGRLYHLMTDLPLQWDVVTRQVTPKVYTAEMEGFERLHLGEVNNEATRQIIRYAAVRMSHLMDTFGPDYPWPLDGYFSDWSCDYCGVGPRGTSTCGAWRARA